MATPLDIRPAIVLTGFGPFPGVAHNVSGLFVKALGDVASQRFGKKHVLSCELPTEWRAASQGLATLYDAHAPVLVLHFGVSAAATGFLIETKACNTQGPFADAAGRLPGCAQVAPHGPVDLDAALPASAIVNRLRSIGVPAQLSHHAGTYLCNSVFYQSLQLRGCQAAPAKAGFIHMPVTFSEPGFDFATALAGGIEIIRTCLQRPPPARRQAR